MGRKLKNPHVDYNGRRYYRDMQTGYYRSRKPAEYLHRAIWMDKKGPIPPGYEIHHVDEDKEHNDISNYEMLTKSGHQIRHGVRAAQLAALARGRETYRRRAADGAYRELRAEVWLRRKASTRVYERVCAGCGKVVYRKTNVKRKSWCSGTCSSRHHKAMVRDGAGR